MVPRTGFEPVTLGLEVLCSIQLSYQGTHGAGAEGRTPITSLENWDNNRYTTPACRSAHEYGHTASSETGVLYQITD